MGDNATMKRITPLCLASLLVWFQFSPAWAQNLQQDLARAQTQLGFTRTPPEDQPVFEPDQSYQLGAGDQLSLQIWGERLNLAYELTVNPQGEILVPRLGLFEARKQTINQLEQQILKRTQSLQRESLQVRVFLRQLRRVRVLVTGYVQRPGYYQVYWGTPLLEALRRAGGVRDNGSVRQIRLSSAQNPKGQLLDLFDFHFAGQLQANPALSGGEQIHVPALAQRVAVLGEVQQPGLYEIQPDDSVETLLKWAGGLKATADPAGLQLWKQGLDQGGVAQLQPLQSTQSLQNGDILYAGLRKLELSEQNLLIQGQVRQPGPLVWRKGLRLMDAIEQAGGTLATADLGSLHLSRQTPQGRQERVINFQDYLSGQGDAAQNNPELLPDDVILVPESFWNIRNVTELTTLVLSTLGIVSVVINLSRGGQ